MEPLKNDRRSVRQSVDDYRRGQASQRLQQGVLPLVVEALRLYFGTRGETREATVRRLRELDAAQADREIERVRAVRTNSRS